MTKNEFKFKIGDIIIQKDFEEKLFDIFKILDIVQNHHIGAGDWVYRCEYIMSGDSFYNNKGIAKLSKNLIEHGSAFWLPARLLTDKDKVELL